MKTIHPAIAEHVMEENEKLRGLLREYAGPYRARQSDELLARTDVALSQQAEPAPAQDEQYPPCDFCGVIPDHHPWHGSGAFKGVDSPHIHACNECRHLLPARPAQTAPQPEQSGLPEELFDGHAVYQETVRHRREAGLLVRTSPENVSDALDAVVRLVKSRRAALSAQGGSKSGDSA